MVSDFKKAAEKAIHALEDGYGTVAYRLDAIHALKAVLEKTEQSEPVATLWQHGETGRTRITQPGYITDCDASWFKAADLFAHPPRREPLSDEQVADIAINGKRPAPHDYCEILLTGPGVDYKLFRSGGECGWVTLEDLVLFTRAIEQAHGIGVKP